VAKSSKGWTLPALLGGAGLVVGAFAPSAVVDYYGEVSLYDVSAEQALLVVLAGAAAALAALLRRPLWIRPAALAAWVGVLLPVLRSWLAPGESGFFDPIEDAVGDVALQLASPEWGVLPLVGGLVLLTVAALRVR
jgi:hypothetical protein